MDKRRHDRKVLRRELERELVLLENRVGGPAARAIKLGDDESVRDADLIHPVLVAREPQDAARAFETAAFDRVDDDVGRQVLVRNGLAHAPPFGPSAAVNTATASSSERCFGCVARVSAANGVAATSS